MLSDRWERDTTEKPFKPRGYQSASVYIVAKEAPKLIEFLKAAFGARELRRLDRPDGRVMHAELGIDDSVVMVADESASAKASPVWMHVYVPNVDATYRRAIEAGGVSVQEPSKRDGDPDRRGGVKDPSGNTWWIGTQVEW